MKNNHYIAIMAGGVGSRFWPASREARPKQFIDMLGMGRSLLQMTYDRFTPLVNPENIFCVTNQAYVNLVSQHLEELPPANIIGEPSRNNTAPSVLVPSDHLIVKDQHYREICTEAFDFAQKNDAIVTLGIHPGRPDTGFGYINYNKKCTTGHIHKVISFREKPDLATAEQFIQSGDYLWNAGMFTRSLRHVDTFPVSRGREGARFNQRTLSGYTQSVHRLCHHREGGRCLYHTVRHWLVRPGYLELSVSTG